MLKKILFKYPIMIVIVIALLSYYLFLHFKKKKFKTLIPGTIKKDIDPSIKIKSQDVA